MEGFYWWWKEILKRWFNSYAPKLVPIFYFAIKHGYRCFIYLTIRSIMFPILGHIQLIAFKYISESGRRPVWHDGDGTVDRTLASSQHKQTHRGLHERPQIISRQKIKFASAPIPENETSNAARTKIGHNGVNGLVVNCYCFFFKFYTCLFLFLSIIH